MVFNYFLSFNNNILEIWINFYKPRTYLLGVADCFRGFTNIGKIITPAVKTHIGATTISIDSRDINLSTNLPYK